VRPFLEEWLCTKKEGLQKCRLIANLLSHRGTALREIKEEKFSQKNFWLCGSAKKAIYQTKKEKFKKKKKKVEIARVCRTWSKTHGWVSPAVGLLKC
jgi:hypothetical protein